MRDSTAMKKIRKSQIIGGLSCFVITKILKINSIYQRLDAEDENFRRVYTHVQ